MIAEYWHLIFLVPIWAAAAIWSLMILFVCGMLLVQALNELTGWILRKVKL